jgi:hypothetical protein
MIEWNGFSWQWLNVEAHFITYPHLIHKRKRKDGSQLYGG